MALPEYVLSANKGGMNRVEKKLTDALLNTEYFPMYSGLNARSTQQNAPVAASATPTSTTQKTVRSGSGANTAQTGFDYAAYLASLQQQEQAARNAAYNVAANQQKQNLGYAQTQLDDTTNAALREAYINKMQSLRTLPQNLTAQGLHGGMTETTLGSMHNNYANARNQLETQRQAQQADILNTYQNNMAQLESQRANGTQTALADLTTQLYKLAANNGVDLLSLIQSTGQVLRKSGNQTELEALYQL